MMKVTATINHMTGKGWKDYNFTFTCDESLGLAKGLDRYAVARGYVKKIMRKTVIHPSMWARLLVDDGTRIEIRVSGNAFVHEVL